MKDLERENVVRVASREANLKRKLRSHLRSLGFRKAEDGSLVIEGTGKDIIRSLHRSQRGERLRSNQEFIERKASGLLSHFATGAEVEPDKVSPVLERVHAGTWQGDLFRLASLTWSVPVSNGFGRRLRYIVWDANNRKIIGLLAIGDPVFNLSVRDKLIGWDSKDRTERLVNVMDAYVLGAVPPYNMLLGGKLVACLLKSRDLFDDFAAVYGGTTGIISQKAKKAQLLAVTTSSSMGRSSVYNRLKLDGTSRLDPIGYTGGWGHFHIPDRLFLELRDYLRDVGHSYADHHRYGQGPNWRMRTTRAALDALGFKADMLRHGIQRQVFITFLASNSAEILQTGEGVPDTSGLASVAAIGSLARDRWIVPRAERRQNYRAWEVADLAELFGSQRTKMRTAASEHADILSATAKG